MKRAIMICFVMSLLACDRDPGEPIDNRGVLLIRNLRTDTIGRIKRFVCGAATDTIDDLPSGTFVVPNATVLLSVESDCYVIRVFNPRDSLIDSRPKIEVSPADTVIIRLTR